MRVILIFASAIFIACAIWLSSSSAQDDAISFVSERETIIVPISLYLLVDNAENPDPEISSNRTIDELREILNGMNDIWKQADIQFETNYVGILEMPPSFLRDVARGHINQLITVINSENITIPNPGIINGFYAREIGGVNGVVPFGIGTNIFFVTDKPSVLDRRVSSHEVGHIFELHHTLEDPNRLLFPGTNGMTLSEEEIAVARYVIKGKLDRMRE